MRARPCATKRRGSLAPLRTSTLHVRLRIFLAAVIKLEILATAAYRMQRMSISQSLPPLLQPPKHHSEPACGTQGLNSLNSVLAEHEEESDSQVLLAGAGLVVRLPDDELLDVAIQTSISNLPTHHCVSVQPIGCRVGISPQGSHVQVSFVDRRAHCLQQSSGGIRSGGSNR